EPAVLVLPHGGEIELELTNDDKNTHCALLPSNGDSQFIWLVNQSRGTATLKLDGPGYYWYGSPTGNDEGRGRTGRTLVPGEAPPRRPAPAPAVEQPPHTRPDRGKEQDMAEGTEYVDAGRAVDQVTLTRVVGSAPPVANNVTYERILNARSEPHNWLTYYGA